MPIQVVLADDHQVVREGIKALLEREESYKVVGEASDGWEAIRLTQELNPDVVILDIGMPLLNGLEAAREICTFSPDTASVVFSRHSEDSYILEALKAGVRGYVVKSQDSADLVQAIREVAQGHFYVSPCVSRTVVDAYFAKNAASKDVLTAREREILQLTAQGKSARRIARILGISSRTAETHRARIRMKLGIPDTPGLVRYAVRHGLIEA